MRRICCEKNFINAYCSYYSASFFPTLTLDVSASEDDFLYQGYGNNATITEYVGSENEINIPSTLSSYTVTHIGRGAFFYKETITSVTIPDSVISIGDSAFYGCGRIEEIIIPISVAKIEWGAFGYCENLKNITVLNPECIIDNDIKTLCTSTIYGYDASTAQKYAKEHNINFISLGTAPLVGLKYSLLSEDTVEITKYTGSSNIVNIPTTIDGYTVTSIGGDAFANCSNIEEITIPNSVVNIGDNAFGYCINLSKIYISSSVTNIGKAPFIGCKKLSTITVDDNNSVYDSRNTCNGIIETKTNRLIQGCKETIIPATVNTIGTYAFSDCYNLTKIHIPNSITHIEKGAFSGCQNLVEIAIPDSVTIIGDYAFSSCYNIIQIDIPNSVSSIGYGAFSWCTGLKEVFLPSSVDSVEEWAFSYCENLTDVFIPISITSIEYRSFEYCNNLSDIWYTGSQLDRDDIWVESYNNAFVNANWHYNTCRSDHTYSNDCDISCDKCEWIRDIYTDHKWDDKCTFDNKAHWIECLICKEKKSIENHKYDNLCDYSCNMCGQTRNVTHSYEWIIDTESTCVDGIRHEECIVCHTKRNENTVVEATKEHIYDNDFDKSCNVCGIIREIDIIFGDTDNDGKVSIKDATAIQKTVAGIIAFDEERFACADTDKDGKITVKDATRIQKFLAALRPEL